jgi:hypothetical protein
MFLLGAGEGLSIASVETVFLSIDVMNHLDLDGIVSLNHVGAPGPGHLFRTCVSLLNRASDLDPARGLPRALVHASYIHMQTSHEGHCAHRARAKPFYICVSPPASPRRPSEA